MWTQDQSASANNQLVDKNNIAFVYLPSLRHYHVFAIPEPIFWLEQMYPEIENHNRQKVLRFIQVLKKKWNIKIEKVSKCIYRLLM